VCLCVKDEINCGKIRIVALTQLPVSEIRVLRWRKAFMLQSYDPAVWGSLSPFQMERWDPRSLAMGDAGTEQLEFADWCQQKVETCPPVPLLGNCTATGADSPGVYVHSLCQA